MHTSAVIQNVQACVIRLRNKLGERCVAVNAFLHKPAVVTQPDQCIDSAVLVHGIKCWIAAGQIKPDQFGMQIGCSACAEMCGIKKPRECGAIVEGYFVTRVAR